MNNDLQGRIDNVVWDTLIYGYASRENSESLSFGSIFDKYYKDFLNTPFPKNDSEVVKNELLEIEKAMKENDNNQSFLAIDRGIENYILSSFDKINIPMNVEILGKITMQVGSVIMRLKHHYQRPRPFQLGWYHKVPIMPYASTGAQSPSYPSGHAGQSRFLCLVLGELYPEKREMLIKFSDYIAYSRIGLGVHFTSDNAFGQAISEYLFKTNECNDFIDEIAQDIDNLSK
jgi:hypothetical protein